MSDDLSIPNPGYRGSRAGRYGTGLSRIRQGMDPDTRRLMIFAGGLGVVLAALIGASALTGRHGGETPVVTADTRPIREKPLNPGGMKIDGAENDVFSAGTDTSNARLASAPESPNTMALLPPAASPSLRPPAASPSTVGEAPATADDTPAPNPPPAAKPATAAGASPKPTATKPPAAAVATHPPASAHQPIVQLAALASEDAARAEWAQLVKKMPDLLNGKQPNYARVERDGHTFWRVRTSGFADVAQARTFCDHVRAKGGGCSVADF